MGKGWRAIALAALLVLPPWHGNAEPAEDEGNVLRVGYVADTRFVEEDRPGHRLGYGYEYMEFLANYGNWRMEYVPGDAWADCVEMLRSGAIDVLPDLPGDYRQVPFASRTDHVVGRIHLQLRLGENGRKPYMRLGFLPGDYPAPSLPEIAREEGFAYELVPYGLFRDMSAALRQGEIDGYVSAMLDPAMSQHVLSIFERYNYRLMVRQDRPELLAALNAAMDQMLTDQPDIRERLANKYMRSKGVPLTLSRQERRFLEQRGFLRAAVIMQQRPYAYREGDTLKGVLPGLAGQMSEDLGIPIELVPSASPEEAVALARDGRVDFVMDAVLDFSWAGELGLTPTQSYLQLSYVTVHRKGIPPGDNARVACCETLLHTKNFIEPRYPADRRVYADSLEECFRLVNEGRAELLFAPRNEVPYLMEAAGAYNLEADAESIYTEQISLGVRSDSDPRLWRILNKEINHLDPAVIRAQFNANNAQPTHYLNPRWLIYHYPMQMTALLALLAAVAGGVLWYRMRLRRRHLEIVQHMAYTDQRYDLPNLAWAEAEAPRLLRTRQKAYEEGRIYAVVFSMDSKAAVSELYGREVLDRNLKDMALQMRDLDWVLLTAAGTDAGHLACLCEGENPEHVRELVESAVSRYGYIVTADARIWLHMRAGICPVQPGTEGLRQFFDCAHVACHETDGSKGLVRFFNDELQERLLLQQRIESHMEKALEEGEFKAWYQPKYDLRTRRIVGAEALVRWQSKEMGFMPPGKFIPLFELNGFVISVDYCLLEQAFELQKQRLAEGKEVVPISVNQSRLHLTEEGYLERMQAMVRKYRLPPGLIELELTETVFGDIDQRDHQKEATRIVNALHDMGFTISVDDFGSGYSSFMMLNYLPMDVMKIDRSLLSASGDSQRMRAILGKVIQLGQSLGMRVICEGIERPEEEQLLLELGCRYGQGYLNAKPMPLADFIAFMEKRNADVAAGRIE